MSTVNEGRASNALALIGKIAYWVGLGFALVLVAIFAFGLFEAGTSTEMLPRQLLALLPALLFFAGGWIVRRVLSGISRLGP